MGQFGAFTAVRKMNKLRLKVKFGLVSVAAIFISHWLPGHDFALLRRRFFKIREQRVWRPPGGLLRIDLLSDECARNFASPRAACCLEHSGPGGYSNVTASFGASSVVQGDGCHGDVKPLYRKTAEPLLRKGMGERGRGGGVKGIWRG